ncbi:hypothetical protein TSAR_007787, partial [Trichomalopsis sarcophagae]
FNRGRNSKKEKWPWGGKEFEETQSFKYLGFTFNGEGNYKEHISELAKKGIVKQQKKTWEKIKIEWASRAVTFEEKISKLGEDRLIKICWKEKLTEKISEKKKQCYNNVELSELEVPNMIERNRNTRLLNTGKGLRSFFVLDSPELCVLSSNRP